MNKKQIAFGAGAFVLAVGAFFAGNANAKFTGVTRLYYTAGTGSACKAIAVSGLQNVTSGSFVGATPLSTVGGTQATLYTNISGSNCINQLTVQAIALKP